MAAFIAFPPLAPRHYTRRNTSGREHLGFSSAITVVLLAATIVLSWVIIRAVGWGVRVD
jgi:ABC-type sugar transport system permease subunit